MRIRTSLPCLTFLPLALVAAPPLSQADLAPQAVERRLAKDLEALAGPAMKGRGNGSPELERAAAWMAEQFKALGLESRIQDVPFILGSERVGGRARITLGERGAELPLGAGSAELPLGAGLEALSFSSDASLRQAPLVFVGLGLATPGYDDLAGLDLKGKVAVIARRCPELPPLEALPPMEKALHRRITRLRAAGAAGVLVLEDEGPRNAPLRPSFLPPEDGPIDLGLPVVGCRPALLEPWMGDLPGRVLQQVRSGVPSPRPQAPEPLLDLKLKIYRHETRLPNLVTRIPGSDPALEGEFIALGAHLDHLGLGERGSLAGPAGRGQVHPGADDNASGSAELLELGRRLAARPPRRSIVLLHFAGEEAGLLGSAHWVQHPTVPLPSVKFMVNFDMVGRMAQDKPMLYLGGLGAPPSALERARSLAPQGLPLGTELGFATGGSDHMSFATRQVPTFFFFTGLHMDYHRPGDTPERINLPGMVQVTDYAEKVVRDLADGASTPVFDPETARLRPQRNTGPARASLGTIPDFTEDPKGFRISGVSTGSAAEAAGLRTGDVITGLGGRPIRTIYDFMAALQAFKPGDRVQVTWLREGREMAGEAVLKAR